jgi:hypothetical protein
MSIRSELATPPPTWPTWLRQYVDRTARWSRWTLIPGAANTPSLQMAVLAKFDRQDRTAGWVMLTMS